MTTATPGRIGLDNAVLCMHVFCLGRQAAPGSSVCAAVHVRPASDHDTWETYVAVMGGGSIASHQRQTRCASRSLFQRCTYRGFDLACFYCMTPRSTAGSFHTPRLTYPTMDCRRDAPDVVRSPSLRSCCQLKCRADQETDSSALPMRFSTSGRQDKLRGCQASLRLYLLPAYVVPSCGFLALPQSIAPQKRKRSDLHTMQRTHPHSGQAVSGTS